MTRSGHIAGLAGALSLVTGACVAESPDAIYFECPWNIAEQRFDPASDTLASITPGGGGFAVTEIGDDVTDQYWMVLHHCATDRYILAVAKSGGVLDLQFTFGQLLTSDKQYTMDEAGIELAKTGAGVRRGQGDIGRCDCETLLNEGYLE